MPEHLTHWDPAVREVIDRRTGEVTATLSDAYRSACGRAERWRRRYTEAEQERRRLEQALQRLAEHYESTGSAVVARDLRGVLDGAR